MDEILKDFVEESKSLIDDMMDILDEIESDIGGAPRLSDFSIFVDRIMGGAKSIALDYDEDHVLHRVGDYAHLCKLVGAKASKIKNPSFYAVVIAFLMDATEMLEQMMECFDQDSEIDIQKILSDTFLDRLKWINDQFEQQAEAEATEKNDVGQSDIDDLLSKFGVG